MTTHTCSHCSHVVELDELPTMEERLLTHKAKHVSVSAYIFSYCPKCGKKDWAEERQFFKILGPRGLYALMVGFMLCFLIGLAYVVFFVN